jgi:hypothetical protein
MTQKRFVVLDAAGVVVSFGSGAAVPPGPDVFEVVTGAPAPGQIGTLGFVGARDLGGMTRAGDFLVQRPISGVVIRQGGAVTINDCPAGTVITVFDSTGGENMGAVEWDVADQPVVIELPDAGAYSIEVDGPLPFLPVRIEVIV